MGPRKPSQKLLQVFYKVLPPHALVEFRTLLGFPCCFINGNMFAGIHRDVMILRLPEEARTDFFRQHQSKSYRPFATRTLEEYVIVPQSLIDDPSKLSAWTRKAFDYGLSLPRKK